MNLRQRLKSSAIIQTVLAALLLGLLLAVNQRESQLSLKMKAANTIVENIITLRFQTFDYLLHSSDRSRQQWELADASLGRSLDTRLFTAPEERPLIANLIANHQTTQAIFQQQVANHDQSSLPPDVRLAVQDRLSSQTLVKTQAMFSDAFRVVELNRTARSTIEGRFNWLVIVIVGLILVITISNFILITRRVTRELKQLLAGTDRIAAGEFSRPIPVVGQDELGQLGDAFNRVAAKLGSYHTDLLQEVKVATKELQKQQSELSRQSALDEALLDSIADGVFAIDPQGMLILFNQAAEDISGYKAAEVLRRPYRDYLHFQDEKDGKAKDGFIATALAGKRAEMDSETVLQRKDGKQVPVADSAAPIADVLGNNQGAIVVFRDVTEERELEKMKEEFVSLASHQLKTPATGVKAFLSMVLDGIATKRPDREKLERGFVAQAYESNERQLAIIEDLLNVSRADSGRLELELQAINLTEMLDNVATEQAATIKERQQTLTVTKPKAAVTVLADPSKLRMVVDNLVSNASKYTPEKGKLELDLAETAQSVTITVKDSGVGIAKSDLPKLFGRFSRIDNPLSVKVGGTGLGLYLAQQIVKLHHGIIRVDSEINKGTTFTVELPKGAKK